MQKPCEEFGSAPDLEFWPAATNIRPWRADRYKLLSWWDMERFSARAFYLIGNSLAILPGQIAAMAEVSESDLLNLNQDASDKAKAHASTWISNIQGWCAGIELKSAIQQCNRIQRRLSRSLTYGELCCLIGELKQRISDAMEGQLFFFVPPAYAEYYGTVFPFGDEVDTAFPSTGYDIREAHTCYALERPTACVFHLMRVLEVSLVALGKVFGLCFDHTNWEPAIDQIEKKIREMHKDELWKVMPDWKDQLEFYAQAVSYLGITKEAWRNYTAHARGKFTPEEAKQMLANVKLFMQKVSQRLTE